MDIFILSCSGNYEILNCIFLIWFKFSIVLGFYKPSKFLAPNLQDWILYRYLTKSAVWKGECFGRVPSDCFVVPPRNFGSGCTFPLLLFCPAGQNNKELHCQPSRMRPNNKRSFIIEKILIVNSHLNNTRLSSDIKVAWASCSWMHSQKRTTRNAANYWLYQLKK